MMRPEPFVHFTIAYSDTQHARFLASLNEVEAGVVSIQARPETRRIGWVARDLLAAVGISDKVSGKGRNTQENVALVPIWLVAHNIGDVIVTGVEVLGADIVAELIELATLSRVRLWLVADHEIGDSTLQVLEQWPIRPVDQDTFDRHWKEEVKQRLPQPKPVAAEVTWPNEVPASDFPVFLAEVRQMLRTEEAAVVENRFRKIHDRVAAALREMPELSEMEATSVLRSHMNDCVTRAEIVTTVRAFQVAAFKAGWFIQVDLGRMLAAGTHDIAAVAADPTTWRKLRAYRQTFKAATCAFGAMDIDIDAQLRLKVSDVSSDGTEVIVGNRPVAAPAGAEPFLRAARLQQLAEGAAPTDRLLIRNGRAIGYRALRDAVDSAATECGVLLTSGLLTRQRDDSRHWRQRHGISIQALDAERETAA